MKQKAGIFVTGLLLGALSGGATALFSTVHPKHRNGADHHGKTERLMGRAVEAPDRDQEELGTWSGQVTMGKQGPGQDPTGAPMGWY